ncbi:MAG: imidazolonepropionase [Pseudomonadota bacterium]
MMKRKLLKGINRLITLSKPDGLDAIDDAAIIIEGGKFSWIGREKDIPKSTDDNEVFNLKDALVTPGLIDCHTHLVHAGTRQNEYNMRSHGMSYWDIAKKGGGILSTVKATREMDEESLYEISAARLQDAISNGITTIEIKTGYGLDEANEIKMARVISRLKKSFPISIKSTFLGAHILPPEFKGKKSEYIKLLTDNVLPRLVKEKLVDACDVFVEKEAFDMNDAMKICERAKDLGLDIHLHVDQFSDCDGGVLAAKVGALSADHLDHISGKGIKAMVDEGIVGVVLPGASFFTNTKRYPPVREMIDRGLKVAISPDYNPGTNPSLNIILTATIAVSLFGMTIDEAWKGMTINAAHALGIAKETGSIEAGKRADLLVFDAPDEFYPIYSYGKNHISRVMINGAFVS